MVPVIYVIYGRESSFAQLDGQVHLQWPLRSLDKGKLTRSNLLTKKETTRELRPTFRQKIVMVSRSTSRHRKYLQLRGHSFIDRFICKLLQNKSNIFLPLIYISIIIILCLQYK